MTLPFCDDCKKPLEDASKMVMVHEVIFMDRINGNRGARGLHFCDLDCCRSWLVKAQNKPMLVQANGGAS